MADVYIGTMGWSYKFWVGNFYPENTPPNRFLAQYSRYFNTVERALIKPQCDLV